MLGLASMSKRQMLLPTVALLSIMFSPAAESSPATKAPLKSAMKTPAAGDAGSAAATSASTNDVLHKYNPNKLRRLDFRVVGKSCAVCLHHMQDQMKALPGVVKAAIMIRKPYGAVVIYDASQVTEEKILEKTKAGVPEVEFEDISDEAIKELPVILIPKSAVPAP